MMALFWLVSPFFVQSKRSWENQMSKKKSKSPSSSSSKPAQPARQRKTSPSRGVSKAQKEMLETLREEILDFREIALIVMSDDGILPPLYGGDYLSGEDDPPNPIDRREVISFGILAKTRQSWLLRCFGSSRIRSRMPNCARYAMNWRWSTIGPCRNCWT